jgi:hypothetical protein
LFFLFGLSSVVVGIVFYALGKAGLGKIVVSVNSIRFEDQIRWLVYEKFNFGSFTNGI